MLTGETHNLDVINETGGTPEGDAGAIEESDYFEKQKRLHLQSLEQDIRERKRYAARLFGVIVWWFSGLFLLLLLQGFFDKPKTTLSIHICGTGFVLEPRFHLADSVLLAVIGGTTANIVGLFYVVAKYLFPTKPFSK